LATIVKDPRWQSTSSTNRAVDIGAWSFEGSGGMTRWFRCIAANEYDNGPARMTVLKRNQKTIATVSISKPAHLECAFQERPQGQIHRRLRVHMRESAAIALDDSDEQRSPAFARRQKELDATGATTQKRYSFLFAFKHPRVALVAKNVGSMQRGLPVSPIQLIPNSYGDRIIG